MYEHKEEYQFSLTYEALINFDQECGEVAKRLKSAKVTKLNAKCPPFALPFRSGGGGVPSSTLRPPILAWLEIPSQGWGFFSP